MYQLTFLDGKDNIELIRCSRGDNLYQSIRDRHYVKNHGTIGRQLHYLIRYNNAIVGIISGASAVWAVAARDEFFGITKENREEIAGRYIINNVVFRLEISVKNLGTQILSHWRKQVVMDWQREYNDKPIGFETFIFGKGRTGAMYKADNWKYVGETAGSTKFRPHGIINPQVRIITDKKLIFCRWI